MSSITINQNSTMSIGRVRAAHARKPAGKQPLLNFMQSIIAQLQQMGKQRTSETYRCTLKSFMQFREDKDVLLEDIYDAPNAYCNQVDTYTNVESERCYIK